MTQQEKLIKHKVGLLELGKQLDNVSRACRVLPEIQNKKATLGGFINILEIN